MPSCCTPDFRVRTNMWSVLSLIGNLYVWPIKTLLALVFAAQSHAAVRDKRQWGGMGCIKAAITRAVRSPPAMRNIYGSCPPPPGCWPPHAWRPVGNIPRRRGGGGGGGAGWCERRPCCLQAGAGPRRGHDRGTTGPWQGHDRAMGSWQGHDGALMGHDGVHDGAMMVFTMGPWLGHNGVMTGSWQCHDRVMMGPRWCLDGVTTGPWRCPRWGPRWGHDWVTTGPWWCHGGATTVPGWGHDGATMGPWRGREALTPIPCQSAQTADIIQYAASIQPHSAYFRWLMARKS